MTTTHSSTGHHLPVVATRSERVAQRSTEHGFFVDAAVFLKSKYRGKFIVLMFLTSIALGCVVRAWNEPFRFRVHCVADRAIVCHTPFSVFSPEQTLMEVYRARANAPRVFVHDPQPVIQLREAIWNTVAVLTRVNSYGELTEEDKLRWQEFLRPGGQGEVSESVDASVAFENLIAYFKNETDLDRFREKLQRIFAPIEQRGVLLHPPPEQELGSNDRILIYHKQDTLEHAVEYRVSEVLLRDGTELMNLTHWELANPLLGNLLFTWVYHEIYNDIHSGTNRFLLKEDENATAKVVKEIGQSVKDVVVEFTPGQLLISTGTILQRGNINILLEEYNESLRSQTKTERTYRFVSLTSVFFLILVIMISLTFRIERRRPHSPLAFFYLMLGIIATVAVAQCTQWTAITGSDWEILPLMLFAMLIAIVYSWELATILSIFLTIVVVCGNGGSADLLIILLGTTVAATVQLGRLRSRKKLVVVGAVAGLAAFFLTVALGIQGNRVTDTLLYVDAGINFLWATLAGLLITGFLPFIEKQFDVLTDMSLLELGDISHPLIRELIKVAPATYGHCTQVGSIAETAADAIHARGLFTRVGAYFHDIGKIMKPEFYSENQGGLGNVHDTLEPQLSTIVLIAHVKDGVDIARQYHLPRPLIDLIEQHHGTSLISFFYGRATKGGKEEVEESTFRYPGPKPQTKEAAVLMIADTCESACRSMGMGVPPNKVEAKIRALIRQKLDDGQFDESGLTLNDLKTVEKSVVNSIVAAMHGRIQYPEGAEKQELPRDTVPSASDSGIQTGISRVGRMM